MTFTTKLATSVTDEAVAMITEQYCMVATLPLSLDNSTKQITIIHGYELHPSNYP